jgi:hypothetical protein
LAFKVLVGLAAIERWLETRMDNDFLFSQPDLFPGLFPGFLGAVISVANRD